MCELSGMAAGPACAARRTEWLPMDAPAHACDWHHLSEDGVLTFWPPEYEPWARTQGVLRTTPARPATRAVAASADPGTTPDRQIAGSRSRQGRRSFEVVNPPTGATYLIDPTLRAEFQTVPLRTIAGEGEIEWSVNGTRIGAAPASRDVHWPLRPGTHRILARDARGQSAEAQITVR